MEDVLYTKDQEKKNSSSKQAIADQSRTKGYFMGHVKRDCRIKVVCNGCGKPRHIKSNCCVKLDEAGANINMKVMNQNNQN